MEDILLQYGVLGVVVIALGYAYLRLEKRVEIRIDKVEARHKSERDIAETRHKVERQEWVESMRNLFNRQDTTIKEISFERNRVQKETNETIKETGNIIIGMQKLFEVHLKK